MEAQDPLSELADIHLPDAVTWWPPALGWWCLAVLFLVLLTVLAWNLRERMQRQRKMRVALHELDQAWQHYLTQESFSQRQDEPGLALLNTINNILRRVALLYYPQEEIAPLSGGKWLAFLDQCDPEAGFAALGTDGLGDSLYRKTWVGDPEPAYNMDRQWIENRYMLEGWRRPWEFRA